MDLPWPLTDGRVGVRPAVSGDAAAFLDCKRRPECQAYVTRTVDTLDQSTALVDERLSQPDSLLCAVVVDGVVVGDIGGRRYRPESLGPEPDVHDFYLGYSVSPDHWSRGIASAQWHCWYRPCTTSGPAASSRRRSPRTWPPLSGACALSRHVT